MASDWTLSNPIDHTKVSQIPQEIRDLKYLLKSRVICTAAEPTARQDSVAFAAADNGSIWIDSDNNKVYTLTDYSVPTWTLISTEVITLLLSTARTFLAALTVEAADVTLTLTNTDHEDTDGGRQSSLRFKGEQSGGEATTLGYITFSHEGTSDDQKGQMGIFVNDGDDDDAPSKQAIGIQSTGKIDVANSLAVLDEDDLVSDDAEVVPTQQSVKAYVDAIDSANDFTPTSYAGEQSVTLPNGLIVKFGEESVAANTTDEVTYTDAFPTAFTWASVSFKSSNTGIGDSAAVQPKSGSETSILEVTNGQGSTLVLYWIAIGY